MNTDVCNANANTTTITTTREHLFHGQRAVWRRDWITAVDAATAALESDPTLVPAYLVRALARRATVDLRAAIADYSRVVESFDPGCAAAWEFRGACYASLAAEADDEDRLALLASAEWDYLRAAELDPQEDRLKLGLGEIALCAERPTAALAHAGEAWGTLIRSESRVIAAWLGSLAALAAGRPEHSWAAYRKALQAREVQLGELDWCVVEVNGWLRRRDANPRPGGAHALAQMHAVHEQFLSHFVAGGPLLA